jgi:hypothetical protein
MKVSLIFGYIGVFLGFLFGAFNILIALFLMNPIVIYGLLSFIAFPTTGLLAIYLDSKDTNMASLLFLISGVGMLIGVGVNFGLISSILFIIAALLEFKDENKISFDDLDQKKKWVVIQLVAILLIPLLYYIKSFFFIP